MAALDGKPLLTNEDTWKKLQNYYDVNKSKLHMPTMFQGDPQRFQKYR